MKKTKLFFYLFFLMASCAFIKAQVTIGSTAAPSPGSLLDLKENSNVGANSNKGFGMPRVNLTRTNTLQPCAADTEGLEHRGLMIVNVATINDVCPGVYLWSGTKWDVVSGGCPTSLSISPNTYNLLVGENLAAPIVTALPKPWGGITYAWNSDNVSKATVNSATGLVTAIAIGGANISTTVNGNSASYAVNVDDVSIGVTPATKDLLIGETVAIASTVLPTWLADKSIASWTSSNMGAATVSNGTVTGVNTGTSTITATTTVRGKTATSAVNVQDVSLSLAPTTVNLIIGTTAAITPTVLPAWLTDKSLASWISSNTAVATVSNGTVTGVNTGASTITATTTARGKTATAAVNVQDVSLSLAPTTVNLIIGTTTTIAPTVLPAWLADKSLASWMSSNTAAATVSNGTVTAVNTGTATITAKTTVRSKTATTSVNVGDVSISLSPTAINLIRGTTAAISPTVLPSWLTNKSVAWTSSNAGAATVSNGTVTGVNTGVATITATTTVRGKTATTSVNVEDVSISLSPTTANISSGASVTLTPTVLPTWLTNKSVSWTSSNNSIATVSNGVVSTGANGGTVVITATTAVNNKSATATIKVCPAMRDGDGNVYATVNIAGRCWIRSNLYTTVDRNSAAFSGGVRMNLANNNDNNSAITVNSKSNLTSWVIPANTFGANANGLDGRTNVAQTYQTYAQEYGLLYNWSQANAVCPAGWHLATETDWNSLVTELGAAHGKRMRKGSRLGWNYHGRDYYKGYVWATTSHASIVVGFDAVPSGFISNVNSNASSFSTQARWWDNGAVAATRTLGNSDSTIGRYTGGGALPADWYSVRCVQD